MEHRTKPENTFSEETMEGLVGLGAVLRKIVRRLVAEGKVKIVSGKIVFIHDK